MKKILYLILHTNKQSDRYNHLVDTWLIGKDFIFYSDHEDLEKNVIKVSNDDTYKSNEEKFVNVVRNLPESYLNYEWYFFVDNDTFVNTKKLESILDELDPENFYGQKIASWGKDKSLEYLSGGAGKLVSNQNLKQMSNLIEHKHTTYADVCMGLYMRENNKNSVHIDYFRSQPPGFYNINITDVKNYISFHYIKDKEEMVQLYKSCMS